MFRWLAGIALLVGSSWCAAQGLTFGVSEGTSGGLDHAKGTLKYQGLADVIAKVVKQKVVVVFVREFAALEAGMQQGRFDLVMARPSDFPARGLRDYGYRFVASAQPEGQCRLVVPKDSAIKSVADTHGKRFVMPEETSYMAKFCNAELRDQGIKLPAENHKFVREQEAVVFYLQQGFADVGGIASYSGAAKTLEKSGLRVLHESVKQPYAPLIAGKRVSAEQIDALRAHLTRLESEEGGKPVLQRLGLQGFDGGTEDRLRALLAWLQKP